MKNLLNIIPLPALPFDSFALHLVSLTARIASAKRKVAFNPNLLTSYSVRTMRISSPRPQLVQTVISIRQAVIRSSFNQQLLDAGLDLETMPLFKLNPKLNPNLAKPYRWFDIESGEPTSSPFDPDTSARAFRRINSQPIPVRERTPNAHAGLPLNSNLYSSEGTDTVPTVTPPEITYKELERMHREIVERYDNKLVQGAIPKEQLELGIRFGINSPYNKGYVREIQNAIVSPDPVPVTPTRIERTAYNQYDFFRKRDPSEFTDYIDPVPVISPSPINSLNPCQYAKTTLSYAFLNTLIRATVRERESLSAFRDKLISESKTVRHSLIEAIANLKSYEYDLVTHLQDIKASKRKQQ